MRGDGVPRLHHSLLYKAKVGEVCVCVRERVCVCECVCIEGNGVGESLNTMRKVDIEGW